LAGPRCWEAAALLRVVARRQPVLVQVLTSARGATAPQLVQLAGTAQAWQRRAQSLELQLAAAEGQQQEQAAAAGASFAAQLQVGGCPAGAGGTRHLHRPDCQHLLPLSIPW
jgi:hypothetical protein